MTDEVPRATPDYGSDPAFVLLFKTSAVVLLNVFAAFTMDGFLLMFAFLVDLYMAVPLLVGLGNAVTYRSSRGALAASGLDVDEVVTARGGSFMAFDTSAGKVFAGGRVRDISAIATVQWIRENRYVYVEITFDDGLGAMLRMPVSSDFEGAEVASRIMALAGLTY